MSDSVLLTIDGGIADVKLNRPDAYNAIDRGVFEGLLAAGQSLRADRSVRVVVLSGAGKGFCSGLDVSSFDGMLGGGKQLAHLLRWEDKRLTLPLIIRSVFDRVE